MEMKEFKEVFFLDETKLKKNSHCNTKNNF